MSRWKAMMFNFEASRKQEEVRETVRALRLGKGQTVADIGAGGGYFSFLFSAEVGREGRVFAVDTNEDFLEFIREQAAAGGFDNVETILAGEGPLALPEKGVDVFFLRNVFHHFGEPASCLEDLRKFLRPGGRIAIIDHRPDSRGGFVRVFKHHASEEEIVRAAEKAGFELFEKHDGLKSQSFLVFG
ncbi:MAG: class I SAM-dependent methyltransferase [Proteobacteria bacterium]|nr:class I SAM-dependent methyltransferase [Pseudomonadota bacterium]